MLLSILPTNKVPVVTQGDGKGKEIGKKTKM